MGYPNTCGICLEDENECSDSIEGWRSTVFGKNFCTSEDREYIDANQSVHDYLRSESCGFECMICEYHNECESGCCAAMEPGDVKRCRD